MTSPNYGNVKSKFGGKRGKRKISSRLENTLHDKNEEVINEEGENVLSHSPFNGETKTHDFLRNLVHEQKSNAPTLFCNDKVPESPCTKFESRDVITAKRICEPNAVSPISQHQSENHSFSNENLTADLHPQNEPSGKLRFYLGGRCVLELVHSSGDPVSTWTQAKGNTWIPTAENINTEKSMSEFCPRKTMRASSSQSPPPPVSLIVDIGRTKNIPLFTLRINRDRCSTWLPHVSVSLVRKAARNPSLNLHSLSFTESLKFTPVLPRKKFVRRAKTLSECFLSSKFLNRKEIEMNDVLNPPNSIFGEHERDEKKFVNVVCSKKDGEFIESNGIRPLPDWYLDPSKAQVPLSEMIGYPRPYLPSNHFSTIKLAKSRMWTKNCIQVNRVQGEDDESHWEQNRRLGNCDREAINEKNCSENATRDDESSFLEVPKGCYSKDSSKNDGTITKNYSSIYQQRIRSNENYFGIDGNQYDKEINTTAKERGNSPEINKQIKDEIVVDGELPSIDHPLDLSIHGRHGESKSAIKRSDGLFYSTTTHPNSLMMDENQMDDELFRLEALKRRECATPCDCNRVDANREKLTSAVYVGLLPNYSMSPQRAQPPPPPPPPVALSPWPLVAYTPTVVNSYYYCCCFLPECPRFNCSFDNPSAARSANVMPCSHISKCSPITHGKTCSTNKLDVNFITTKTETDSSDRESSMLKELLMKPTDE